MIVGVPLCFQLCATAAPPTQVETADKLFKTPFNSEAQFIVETITTDLAEQVYFGKNHRLASPGEFSLRTTEKMQPFAEGLYFHLSLSLGTNGPAVESDLAINGPIWAPDVFWEVAKALAKRIGLEARETQKSSQLDLLATLTDGAAGTLEKQNSALSAALEEDFCNAGLHEKAALLIGAFALRDHAGCFSDVRLPLCRMTAHLCMAKVLSDGKTQGNDGRIAKAMLTSLMNNERAALEELNGLDQKEPNVASWSKVLRAFNTGDYRPLEKLPGASRLERQAWFQAYVRSVDTDVAWGRLSPADKRVLDYVRIVEEANFSVETGNEIQELSLPLEINEIASVYNLSQNKKLTSGELTKALNQEPERCFAASGGTAAKVRVIGWGQWAGFFQRHLCQAMVEGHRFLLHKLGVPEDARAFDSKCESTFGALRLYPFVRRYNCEEAVGYRKALSGGGRVTEESPHLVPVSCWNDLLSPEEFAPSERISPLELTVWLRHGVPYGTAFEGGLPLRQNHTGKPGGGLATLEALHQLAPYDRTISHSIFVEKYHEKPTFEQIQELYGPVLPYASYAMIRAAETVKDQPVRFKKIMTEAAQLDGFCYSVLGDYCAARNESDEAAEYYRKEEQNCPDTVGNSYHACWRVKYYLSKGNTNEAQRIADDAGEVYSAVGLEAKAYFLEAIGSYTNAFEWYSKIEERYDNPAPLLNFCNLYKTRTGDNRFDNEIRKRTESIFPGGRQKVTLDQFTAVPTEGIVFEAQSELMRQVGLGTNDVVVALNGIRIHNTPQYNLERALSSTPEMVLIVWQKGHYREIKATPPNHMFGVGMRNYHAE